MKRYNYEAFYDTVAGAPDAEMVAYPDGEWVQYTDAAALADEVERLRGLLHLYAYPGSFEGRPSDDELRAQARAALEGK